MGGDVRDARFEFGMEVVSLRIRYQTTACAVAAVSSTTVSDEKEDAIGVTMDDAGYRRRLFFAHRVS